MLTAEARPSPGVSPAFHGESPAIPITVAKTSVAAQTGHKSLS